MTSQVGLLWVKGKAGAGAKEGWRNNSLTTHFAVFCSLSLPWERELGELYNFQVKDLARAGNGAQGGVDEEKVGNYDLSTIGKQFD